MRKRFFAVIPLVIALLFSGCEGDSAYAEAINSALQAKNAEVRRGGEYMLEITFLNDGNTTPLYYAKGTFSCDIEQQTADTSFNQTWLGSSWKSENHFVNGVMTGVTDGEPFGEKTDAEELFSLFPYFNIPLFDATNRDISVKNNARGEIYTYIDTNGSEICGRIVGGDIHELAYVLKSPQTDKTEYSDVACSATIADGNLLSFGWEFDVKLYDKPAYIPGGYSVPESEYTVTLHVNAKINY